MDRWSSDYIPEKSAGGLKVGGPVEALLPAGIDPLLELVDLFLGYGFEPALGFEVLSQQACRLPPLRARDSLAEVSLKILSSIS